MAYSRNNFDLIGRIADIKTYEKTTVLRLALNRRATGATGEGETTAHFLSVSVFKDNQRAYIASRLDVGDLIGCNGYMREGSYQKDSQTVYVLDLVATNVGLLTKKKAPSAE